MKFAKTSMLAHRTILLGHLGMSLNLKAGQPSVRLEGDLGGGGDRDVDDEDVDSREIVDPNRRARPA